MVKPTILAVDDDLAVLSAITRDLQRYYGRDYRILQVASGAAALATLDELQRRNEPVALCHGDASLPAGTERSRNGTGGVAEYTRRRE